MLRGWHRRRGCGAESPGDLHEPVTGEWLRIEDLYYCELGNCRSVMVCRGVSSLVGEPPEHDD
ncbi:hypothetical protein GCM10010399_82070 [Dactylosporangium fulvum]